MVCFYGWLNPCVAVCYVLHDLGFPDEHHFSPLKAIRGKGIRWHRDVPLNGWVASIKLKRIDLRLPIVGVLVWVRITVIVRIFVPVLTMLECCVPPAPINVARLPLFFISIIFCMRLPCSLNVNIDKALVKGLSQCPVARHISVPSQHVEVVLAQLLCVLICAQNVAWVCPRLEGEWHVQTNRGSEVLCLHIHIAVAKKGVCSSSRSSSRQSIVLMHIWRIVVKGVGADIKPSIVLISAPRNGKVPVRQVLDAVPIKVSLFGRKV